MANQEHLNVLKQGVEIWNQWRQEHPDIHPDLVGIDLREANLIKANLVGADLRRANLSRTALSEADLNDADLSEAYLNHTNLSGAYLSGAYLIESYLRRSDLSSADLSGADLSGADLSNVDLRGADLSYTRMWNTILGELDLRSVKGLDTIEHLGPSHLTINTIYCSKGEIPEVFVRGTGADNTFITYMHALAAKQIEYYTCFISYSSKDQIFARRLYADLQSNGVRCWFAPEDLKIGDHYHQRIDDAIRLYDKLVLILSGQSVASAWVEYEVVAAREKEELEQRPMLFPIRLDEAVMDTAKAWAADVRRRWHIGNFTQWEYLDAYQQAFERLLRDLKAEQKPKD